LHKQPDLKFLLSHPVHFISLGFGSGLASRAPGTFGTVVGLPLYWLICNYTFTTQIIIVSILFLLGILWCDKTGKAIGVSDHGSIVWDEIVAMMLVLAFTPMQWIYWVLSFMLFRLFDIWKPFPIGQVDERVKGGLGVMLDDLLAAAYAIFCVKVVLWMS
jgi:phosphatidylglycerophosphatase A